jgi:hypothetical protein
MTATVLPLVRVADRHVSRPFPLKFRTFIEGGQIVTSTVSFETSDERDARAAELVMTGKSVVFLPSQS